jgi:peptide/nickel transport system permease protein
MIRAVLILGLILFLVIFGPALAPYDPLLTEPEAQNQPPTRSHWMGTDFLGRDVFSRLLHGGQRTIGIAALAAAAAVITGGIPGLMAGYFSGWVDRLVAPTMNAMLAFPPLVIALIVVSLVGRAEIGIVIAVSLALLPLYAQICRATAAGLRSAEYVESSRALGGTAYHILIQHVLRNALPTLSAYAAVIFSYALINSAVLGFLGVAGEPGVPEWGTMLAEGRGVLRAAPWVSVFPGLALTITVMAVNSLSGIFNPLPRS